MIEKFKKELEMHSKTTENSTNKLLNVRTSFRELRMLFNDSSKLSYDNLSKKQNRAILEMIEYCNCAHILNFENTKKVAYLHTVAGCLNENSYMQYVRLKDYLIKNDLEELYPNLMSSICEIIDCDELCTPVYDYLLLYFGDVSIEMLKELNINSENKHVLYDLRLFLDNCLTYFSVLHTPIDGCVYIEDLYNEEPVTEWTNVEETSEYNSDEEYSEQHKLCCRERLVDEDTFEKIKNIKIMPMMTSFDLDMCECLAGCLVTLKNEKTGEAVTYSIAYQESVHTISDIDDSYSAEERGFDAFSSKELLDILTHNDLMGCDIPVALHLFKMKEPILGDI